MAGNSGVRRVPFKNETTETVTFVVETIRGPQAAFTLIPNGLCRFETVQTPLTHELLRLVVGKNSKGQYTNECVSTDELAGLDKVVVKWRENPGNNSVNNSINNFVLEKNPRRTNEGPSVTRPRGWFAWPHNAGESHATLGV